MFKSIFTYSFVALLLCSLTSAKGQTDKNVWKTLANIKYEIAWDEAYQFDVKQAVFSDEVLALNGKEITVRGYLLPEKGYKTHKEFILSSLPYNLCYFCGKAGPETVMEVSSLDAVKYSTDPIVMKGTLMLNLLDPGGLPYILLDAKLVK